MKTISYAFKDGSKYIGECYETEKDIGEFYEISYVFHGKGRMTYRNGDMYWGEWKDGQRHGKGTYTLAYGRKYVGRFKNGEFVPKKDFLTKLRDKMDRKPRVTTYLDELMDSYRARW